MRTIDDLLVGVQTVAVVCFQWGDSGKGKFSDIFGGWADVIYRGTGGNNAGHTTVINGVKRVFHLIPAGIVYDAQGKINILGNGMVLDLECLCGELDSLEKDGGTYNHLMISEDAHVILPFHVDVDKRKNASQANGGVGSTGRGIGPCYTDKISRHGIMVRDLYNLDVLEGKVRARLEHYEAIRRGEFVQGLLSKKEITLSQLKERIDCLGVSLSDEDKLLLDEAETQRFVNGDHLKLTEFYEKLIWHPTNVSAETKRIIEELKPYANRIKPFVKDTLAEMHNFLRQGKKISIEGAQGTLLSIEFGTYPFVTSSDCSINGTAAGAGISAGMIDKVFGIVKFPYMTRVGAGPFPTEFGGEPSEKYCAAGLEHDINFELTKYGIPFQTKGKGIPSYNHSDPRIIELINSSDPFLKGIGIRLAGEEYGATTGRPRRTGWTDLVALRYALNVNRPAEMILTKADVLQGAEEFALGDGYIIDGYHTETFSRDSKKLSRAKPTYTKFKGFNEDISQIQNYADLPFGLKESIDYAERFVGGKATIVSTGPEREQYIIR